MNWNLKFKIFHQLSKFSSILCLLLLLSQFCYHLLEFIFDYYFLDPFSMSSILIFNSFYLLYFPSEFCSIFLSWFNFWHISPAVHWHCCINLAIMFFLFKKVFFIFPSLKKIDATSSPTSMWKQISFEHFFLFLSYLS